LADISITLQSAVSGFTADGNRWRSNGVKLDKSVLIVPVKLADFNPVRGFKVVFPNPWKWVQIGFALHSFAKKETWSNL